MQVRGVLRIAMTLAGLVSLILLFITGDNYSLNAYPILHLNFYYSVVFTLMSAWFNKEIEKEKFKFEAKLFFPIWLAMAAVITAFEFLGSIIALLWFLWMVLPLFYMDRVLRFISDLAYDFKLKEDIKRPVLLMIILPLTLVLYYRTIYGLQALALLGLYILDFTLEFKHQGEENEL
ncbi:hypothetical protein [Pyrococcus horikoshii]|nr:hypothetical protein [Pyrococcus horikoshii]HII60303.1 hypothetical protein [Pyrococcus horikoshii]